VPVADVSHEGTTNFTSIRVATLTNASAEQMSANVKNSYEAAVAPPPPPVVPPPRPKLTDADWERIK